MKRIASTFLTLAAAMALVVMPTVTAVHAERGCTNAALSGSYAAIWQGFTNPNGGGPGNQAPWAGAGTVVFDGARNFSMSYNTSVDGQIYTAQSTAGTYTVNSDCTGSLTFTSGDGAGLTLSMVLIGEGKEVVGVDTSSGDTASFALKKQRSQD